MSIIIAFFCGLCFYAIADYISAKSQMLEAEAEAMKIQNELKKLEREKGETNNELKCN